MAATKGQIVALGVGAIIAGFGANAYAKKRRKKKKKNGNNCAPYQWDPVPIMATINQLLDNGWDDPNQIALDTAGEHFSTYPGGGTAVFPAQAGAPPGVVCVWERVYALVQATIAQRGVQAKPWEIIEEWSAEAPTPGKLFRVTQGWNLAKLARDALQNAGVPNPKNNNGVYVNQLAMRKLMECSPYNDALFSIEGAGGKSGPNGRGISLNAVHADNRQRMLQGLPARRAMTGLQSHDGSGGFLPFIWVPLIEPGAPVPVVAEWDDGRSGINPPSEILAFGIEGVTPGLYGCAPYSDAAEDLPL